MENLKGGTVKFKSILVDIDVAASVHPALDCAVRLCRQCDAHLQIVDVVSLRPDATAYLPVGILEEIVRHRESQLSRIAQSFTGLRIDSHALIGRPADALIKGVMRSGHDLLIRAHARDLSTRLPSMYGAVSMELFRKCPCPVWALGPADGSTSPGILAAVNAAGAGPEEQALNVKIIDCGLTIAELQQGSLTILQAHEAISKSILSPHASADVYFDYIDKTRKRVRDNLKELAASFGSRLNMARIEVREGVPEDVIPEFVVSEGIDLVVMGTVARTGISGLLIGNTAERLLQRLLCSVLTVKPDGFFSPVRVDQ
jgi:universal stress protein E